MCAFSAISDGEVDGFHFYYKSVDVSIQSKAVGGLMSLFVSGGG